MPLRSRPVPVLTSFLPPDLLGAILVCLPSVRHVCRATEVCSAFDAHVVRDALQDRMRTLTRDATYVLELSSTRVMAHAERVWVGIRLTPVFDYYPGCPRLTRHVGTVLLRSENHTFVVGRTSESTPPAIDLNVSNRYVSRVHALLTLYPPPFHDGSVVELYVTGPNGVRVFATAGETAERTVSTMERFTARVGTVFEMVKGSGACFRVDYVD